MSGGGYPFWLKNQTNDADMEVIMVRHETSKEKTRKNRKTNPLSEWIFFANDHLSLGEIGAKFRFLTMLHVRSRNSFNYSCLSEWVMMYRLSNLFEYFTNNTELQLVMRIDNNRTVPA